MPEPYCYEYPRPMVTVDLLIFGLDGDSLRALFIRRKNDPFQGCWAIPGGYLEMDETLGAAARRELKEETGLDAPKVIAEVGVFADPGRDPRGRTISVAHVGAIAGLLPPIAGGDDAAEAAWLDPFAADPLAFDHGMIRDRALHRLREAVLIGPGGLDLLPDPFEVADLHRLFHALGLDGTGRQDAWIERQLRGERIGEADGASGGFFRVGDRASGPWFA